MRIVVGLGNPGEEYTATRHNVGFEVVDRLAARHGATLRTDRRLAARVAPARVAGEETLLVEPLSYMNLNGPVVARIVREREVPIEGLLVVADDYHLPLGELRMRRQGTAGGHNGLKSLIGALGTQEFTRLRIGIGEAPPGGAVDFVLTRFRRSEKPVIEGALDRAADCVEEWCRAGADAAMNKFNGPPGA